MKAAYAKKISGGYSVISLYAEKYVTDILSDHCSATGLRVYLAPKAHDFLVSVSSRGTEALDLFLAKFNRLLSEWSNECHEADQTARENTNSISAQTEQLARWWANASIPTVVHNAINRSHDNANDSGTLFNNKCERVLDSIASTDGVPVQEETRRHTQSRKMTGNPFLDLLLSGPLGFQGFTLPEFDTQNEPGPTMDKNGQEVKQTGRAPVEV